MLRKRVIVGLIPILIGGCAFAGGLLISGAELDAALAGVLLVAIAASAVAAVIALIYYVVKKSPTRR